jgi:hypothetical protein
MVVLDCKNRDKLVKAYKNGQQQSYSSEVEIIVDDINAARNIAEALKATIANCEK